MGWILSASRTSARILERVGSELSLVETIEHPEGRLRDRDIDTDAHGRAFESASSARHALSTSERPHDRIAQAFANELAEKLKKGRLTQRYERLTLVAEPHFLGLLRAALDPATARLVSDSIAKDLEPLDFSELRSHLLDSKD